MEMTPGKIHNVEIESKIFNKSFEIQYYLPKNYSDLYKHHVIITFDSQDFFKYGQIHREYEKLYTDVEVERSIIVGIPYPSVDWRNHYFSPNGEHHNDFIKFIKMEFLPFIDAHFPTYKVGNSRLLMGESLAGSVAFSIALSYPDTFSQALAFSPFVDEAFLEKFKNQSKLNNLNLYHTIGLEEDDFTTIMGNQADFLTPNRELNQYLETQSLNYVYKELEGGHIWKTWKPEIKSILKHYFS